MAKSYDLVDRSGKVLGSVTLAKGVTMPEIGRALIASKPLQIVDPDAAVNVGPATDIAPPAGGDAKGGDGKDSKGAGGK